MTVADYFIDFFVENGVTDVFGYQGGMIAYLFDSMGRNRDKIKYHVCSTEQGAALAACGYAQATGKMGVVLSTSGPGFTNLLTGIANAWFDSIPLFCISGQVNTKDKRRTLPVRQLGFQEIQATAVAQSITKSTYEIDDDTDIVSCLREAWDDALRGRKGPVFLDLPINICRNEIWVDRGIRVTTVSESHFADVMALCFSEFKKAKKPLIIAGAGITQAGVRNEFREFVQRLKVPVITTLPAIDVLPTDNPYKLGYLGATARREAGIALASADFVLTLGTRLCAKQIGYQPELFAPRAKLFRVDIDNTELQRRLKEDEIQIHMELREFLALSAKELGAEQRVKEHSEWVLACNEMKRKLTECDVTFGNKVVHKLTDLLPDGNNITLDVGNNMIYGAQSSIVKKDTRIFVSGGFGTMGYALPAAIGTTIGNNCPTCVISGDGGMQMNIQELNIIGKKRLPIKIFVLNNRALGHILLFQEVYLNERYYATDENNGDYFSCDFVKIAEAYGIRGYKLKDENDVEKYKDILADDMPALFELEYQDCSILPNIHGGKDCLVSGPHLDDEIINDIRELGFQTLNSEE